MPFPESGVLSLVAFWERPSGDFKHALSNRCTVQLPLVSKSFCKHDHKGIAISPWGPRGWKPHSEKENLVLFTIICLDDLGGNLPPSPRDSTAVDLKYRNVNLTPSHRQDLIRKSPPRILILDAFSLNFLMLTFQQAR